MPSNGLLIRWSLVRFQPGEPIKTGTSLRFFRLCGAICFPQVQALQSAPSCPLNRHTYSAWCACRWRGSCGHRHDQESPARALAAPPLPTLACQRGGGCRGTAVAASLPCAVLGAKCFDAACRRSIGPRFPLSSGSPVVPGRLTTDNCTY
jgi:hypothetical protein